MYFLKNIKLNKEKRKTFYFSFTLKLPTLISVELPG